MSPVQADERATRIVFAFGAHLGRGKPAPCRTNDPTECIEFNCTRGTTGHRRLDGLLREDADSSDRSRRMVLVVQLNIHPRTRVVPQAAKAIVCPLFDDAV